MNIFKVGQKVVCIREGECIHNGISYKVFKDKIYIVEEIGYIPDSPTTFEAYIVKVNDGAGVKWKQERFRPLKYESSTAEILEKFTFTEEKADVEIKELQNV